VVVSESVKKLPTKDLLYTYQIFGRHGDIHYPISKLFENSGKTMEEWIKEVKAELDTRPHISTKNEKKVINAYKNKNK
jgi:hypothetical protein